MIRYTLALELDAGSARLQYWAVDKTPQGWSQTMQNCPKVAAALDNGVLTASGFDFLRVSCKLRVTMPALHSGPKTGALAERTV